MKELRSIYKNRANKEFISGLLSIRFLFSLIKLPDLWKDKKIHCFLATSGSNGLGNQHVALSGSNVRRKGRQTCNSHLDDFKHLDIW